MWCFDWNCLIPVYFNVLLPKMSMFSWFISSFTALSFATSVLLTFHVPAITLVFEVSDFLFLLDNIIRSFNLAMSWTPLIFPKNPQFFLSNMLSGIQPEGPIIQNYIINHFVFPAHMVFLVKFRMDYHCLLLCSMNWCFCHPQ